MFDNDTLYCALALAAAAEGWVVQGRSDWHISRRAQAACAVWIAQIAFAAWASPAGRQAIPDAEDRFIFGQRLLAAAQRDVARFWERAPNTPLPFFPEPKALREAIFPELLKCQAPGSYWQIHGAGGPVGSDVNDLYLTTSGCPDWASAAR